METVRIAHLSDLHVAELANADSFPKALGRLFAGRSGALGMPPGPRRKFAWFASYDAQALKTLIHFLRELHEDSHPLDAIVVTGDLATTGRRNDQIKAWQLVADSGNHNGESLAAIGPPVHVMPGNHDRYGGIPIVAPTYGTEFDVVFTSWKASRGVQRFPSIGSRNGKEQLEVVAADFTRPNASPLPHAWPLPIDGTGEVDVPTLDNLERTTMNLNSSAVLWAVHFPPRLGADCPKELHTVSLNHRLVGGDAVLARAAKCGVFGVICGHVHNNCSYIDRTGVRVSVAGSASQFKTRFGHWAHLLEFDVDGGVILAARILDLFQDRSPRGWGICGYSRSF